MADTINVNEESAEGFAADIGGAASYFRINPLLPEDAKSTISANGKGKTAYYKAQEAAELFGSCLDQEAKNIQGLGAEFSQYDEMLAALWDSGTRYPVLTEVKE